MLILTASDVTRVFDMAAAFEAVERAALSHVGGTTSAPPRLALHLPSIPAEVLVIPGSIESRLFGLKVWYAMESATGTIPHSSALITLLDVDLGHEIVMDGGVITDLRTGAMTGLAASRLAPPGTRTVGVVGAGIQGRTQVLALAHAIETIDVVRLFSRNAERRTRFVAALQAELDEIYPTRGMTVLGVDSAASACRNADIVVAATTSPSPVISDSWLGANTLVCGVGSHTPGEAEIEARTVGRASRVVVDTIKGAVDGAGDIALAIDAGLVRRQDVVELGNLLAEEHVVADGEGISVFKSVGFSAADLVSAQLVVRRAFERGLGTVVDLHS